VATIDHTRRRNRLLIILSRTSRIQYSIRDLLNFLDEVQLVTIFGTEKIIFVIGNQLSGFLTTNKNRTEQLTTLEKKGVAQNLWDFTAFYYTCKGSYKRPKLAKKFRNLIGFVEHPFEFRSRNSFVQNL
jgi:hypothetical protein